MTAPGLVGSLQGAFQGTGDPARQSPGDASTAMTGALQGNAPNTGLPARPQVDTDALGRLVERFTHIDLSSVDRAVGAASSSGGGAGGLSLPDPAALLGRAGSIVRVATSLRQGGAVALLDQLRAPPSANAAAGLGTVEASLGQLAAARQSPALAAILDTLRAVIPGGLAIDGPADRIGDALATGRDLVTMIGGMMAMHTAAVDLRDTAAMVDALLAPETAAALVARARTWVEADGVVAAIASVADPEDPAQVAGAEQAVGQVAAALAELADTLTRAMGYGEATVVHADPAKQVQALDAAAAQLRSVGPTRVRASAEALARAIEPIFPAAAPTLGLEAAWTAAGALVGDLAGAITAVSVDPVTRPVQQSLGAVTSALHEINRVFGEVSGAIRGAFATVRGFVAAIDLQSIARAVTQFLQPLVDLLHEIDQFLGAVIGVIEDCAKKITDVVDVIKAAISTGAGYVKQAFDEVASLLRGLGLDKMIDDARGAIQQVADALHQVQLQPYFDKAIEVTNTAADVVGAIPFGMLPDSVKQKLDVVVQPIESIDFQTDVADVLKGELHDILARIDTDALGALDDAFAQITTALRALDPAQIIEPLDHELDAFMLRVHAIDPNQILQPAYDAVKQIQAQIGAFDLRQRILGPVEHFFDDAVAALQRVDPAPLLQPIEDQVAGVRQRILDVIHIDQWAAKVDQVHRTIDNFLTRLDPTGIGPKLDALVDAAFAAAPAPADGSIVGSLVAALVDGMGLHARPRSFVAVLGWITGDDGAAEVRRLVGAADASLAHARDTVRGTDLRAVAATLDAGYRRVAAAVAAHPDGSLLRRRLDPVLAGIAPLDTLGALGASQDRYLAALGAAADAVHAMASTGQAEITAATGGVRDAFRPLAVVRGRVIALGRGLGVDVTAHDLRGLLAPVLDALRPSRVLALFAPVVAAARDKIRHLLIDGLVTPVQDAITEVKTLIDQLDISVFRRELEALFLQVKADLEAFRPSHVLGPTLDALDAFKTHLTTWDPLAPIRHVLDHLREVLDELAHDLRPSRLLAGVTDTYQQVLHLAESLNVRTLVDPVMTALHDIEHQLDGGLDGAATALTHLQGSLRSLGTGGAAGGDASMSIHGGMA